MSRLQVFDRNVSDNILDFRFSATAAVCQFNKYTNALTLLLINTSSDANEWNLCNIRWHYKALPQSL